MAQQNPRLATGTTDDPTALIALASQNPNNPALLEYLKVATEREKLAKRRLEREEKEVEDQEVTARNMRRQNAEAMERKRQDEIAFQSRCDHMTEHRDRASIVGQRAHNGKYILLCSKCSKIWNGAEEVPPGLNNLIKWEWIGGPQ